MEAGREARVEEEERTVLRREGKVGGREETRRMPRDDGPKARSRVEKGMLSFFPRDVRRLL